ncbi:hypothetical protein [Nonomuraea sp. SBT364]|uniref:hypothetical protein n=1 Tax=Nonomuraea sp. SBT364 TaxID=1580530 RepID=UPI000A5E45D4|nr:hypothetical protein [Nonomuraea sp. SBT364]
MAGRGDEVMVVHRRTTPLPGDPAARVAESVRRRLDRPPPSPWTEEEAAADDAALTAPG